MLARLIALALRRRAFTLVVAGGLAVGGLFAYLDLPIGAYPDVSTPQVQVIVKAPGLSPPEVELRVTRPLESDLRGIPRLTTLRSLTKHALAVVTLDFTEETDIYWARQQVSERIGRLLASLPPGVEGGLAPITSPLSEVFMFMVEGEGYSLAERRAIFDWQIRPRLLSVDGVADVNVLGGKVRTYEVRPRLDALRRHGVAPADIVRALRRDNHASGADRVVQNDEVLLVRTLGRLRGRRDIERVVVARRGGAPVTVADLAEVRLGHLVRYGGVTRNGEGEGVQGLVLLRTGANGRKTVDGVRARLREIAASLPPGIRLVTIYDRGDLIASAVRTVEGALTQGVVIVLVVLLLFLGDWRSAVATGAILPLTVLGTFLGMRVAGLGANLMSLGGIAIAVGILVDAAVVVVENVHRRFRQRGAERSRAAVVLSAAAEVAPSVLAAVLIIIAAFAPILTLEGLEGRLFVPLALTLCIALGISLLLSFTAIPALASLLMRRGGDAREGGLMLLLVRLYRPSLRWTLGHRRLATGLAVGLVLGAAALFPRVGREFLPQLQEGTEVIQVEKLPTISLGRSMELDGEIQRALLALPEVVGVYSRVGADELRLDPMGFHQTDNFIVTAPRERWTVGGRGELLERMRGVLARFPWVSAGFTQPIEMRLSEMLTGVRAAVGVKIFGDDLGRLEAIARRVERVLAATPGAVDVFRMPIGGQRYLRLDVRRDVAGRLGLAAADVAEAVSASVGGARATEVMEGARPVPVVVRLPRGDRESAEAIAEVPVRLPGGGLLPLGRLVAVHEETGPMQIRREEGRRVVVLTANVEGRDVVGFVDAVRRAVAAEVKLPRGYEITYGGQFENERRASRRLALVGPASLVAIFFLLYAAMGTARHATLILLNIPLAFVGGVVALYTSGLYLSVPASVGFIALLGVAVENGVVLVNHFNDLRREGLALPEAVRFGAERRLRPVLMTAILTVLGLVPLALASGPGSEIQRPLAVVVIGGTFSSMALTLMLLPTLYLWLEERRPDLPPRR